MAEAEGRLAGRCALVTGAAGGIGRESVALLAAAGARVCATDVTAPGADSIPGATLGLRQDVTREEDWRAVLERIEADWGRLDILVNNAGRALTRDLEETSLEEWRDVMAVNLDSAFLGVKLALPLIARSPRPEGETGSIVNLSSVAGQVGAARLAAYSAAKGGLRLFTKSAALHCAKRGHPVRVNSLHPGFTESALLDGIADGLDDRGLGREAMKQALAKRQPLGRLASPREIAEAVLFLASPASSYMTGAELTVDGGFTAQ